MRRLFPLSMLVVLLALPSSGRAQEEEPEESAVEEEPGYEPDQRGEHDDEGGEDTGEGGEDTTSGEDLYEPDQRGGHEEEGGDTEELETVQEAPPPAPEPTMVTSDEADAGYGGASDDRGRGFGVYTRVYLGAGLTGLDAIEGDNLVTPTQQGSFGVSFGFALGLRIGPISVGPRVGFAVDPSFVLGTTGIDVAAELTTDDFVPTLRLGLGYAFLMSVSDALPSQESANGLYAELGAGFRYYVGGPFHFGAEASGGWLALFRSEVSDCEDPCTDMGMFDLRRPGQSHGLTLRLHIFGGFAF